MTSSRLPLILASTSQPRRALLAGTGLTFSSEAARIDERAIEAGLGGAEPRTVAETLSVAKAVEVSLRYPGALVIGADQTLGLGDRSFHKPASHAAARQQLRDLRGKTHRLHSGIAIARDGDVVFRHVAVADMTMRDYSEDMLERYLLTVGDNVLRSVGCYQLEGPGIQLFEAIDGDYFTILGLPLLPLLAALRSLGYLDD